MLGREALDKVRKLQMWGEIPSIKESMLREGRKKKSGQAYSAALGQGFWQG